MTIYFDDRAVTSSRKFQRPLVNLFPGGLGALAVLLATRRVAPAVCARCAMHDLCHGIATEAPNLLKFWFI